MIDLKNVYLNLLNEITRFSLLPTLVAVSKTKSVEDILALYQLGQKDFGENYVQEWKEKYEVLKEKAPEIKWHFIGQLQSNKVKYLVAKVALIHSVDRLSLLEEINRQSQKQACVTHVLIEVSLSPEANKGGVFVNDLKQLLAEASKLNHVLIDGLMIIPPPSEAAEESRKYFKQLKQILAEVNAGKFYKQPLSQLSMGMSNDYRIALEEGATLIRVGSKLFGIR